MSEYKGKHIFSTESESQNNVAQTSENKSSAQTKTETSQESIRAQIQFEQEAEFIPMSSQQIEQQAQPESDLIEVIHPPTKTSWLIPTLLTIFAALLAWQCVDNFLQAYQNKDWLAISWSSFIALLALLGIKITIKELWTLAKLRKQLSTQEQAQTLLSGSSSVDAKAFCQQLAKQANINLEHAGYDRWLASVNQNHDTLDILTLYDDMVISLQDNQAKKLISQYASESAVLVAVSPLALADLLLVAWRSFKMIDELSHIYGIELGYWARIRLLKLVFINMALAGSTELAIDAGMDIASMTLTEKLSARAAQGVGIGILTARLGIKAVSLLRPLPWRKDKALRLAEIRKLVVAKVIGKG